MRGCQLGIAVAADDALECGVALNCQDGATGGGFLFCGIDAVLRVGAEVCNGMLPVAAEVKLHIASSGSGHADAAVDIEICRGEDGGAVGVVPD